MLQKLPDLVAHTCILCTGAEGLTMSLGQFKVFNEFQVGLEPVSRKKIIKIESKIV